MSEAAGFAWLEPLLARLGAGVLVAGPDGRVWYADPGWRDRAPAERPSADELHFPDGAVAVREELPELGEGAAAWVLRPRAAPVDARRADLLRRLAVALRTPAQSILGLGAELLHDADPARRGLVEAVLRNARQLAVTVDDLLTLEGLSLDPPRRETTFDPVGVLEAAADQLALVASARRITLLVRATPGLGQARGDAGSALPIVLDELDAVVRRSPPGRLVASVRRDGAALRFELRAPGPLVAPSPGVTAELAARVVASLLLRVGGRREEEPTCVTLVLPAAPAPAAAPVLRRIPVSLHGDPGPERDAVEAALRDLGAPLVGDPMEAEVVVWAADPSSAERVEVATSLPVVWVSPKEARRGVLSHPLSRARLAEAIVQAHGPESARSGALGRLGGRGARVLVVEDADANATVLEAMLTRGGHTPERVVDAAGALAALARHRYDLALVDLDLPGGTDGVELSRRIRAREAGTGRRTPLVPCTAHATEEARRRCAEVGMDGFLAKPFTRDELLRVVRERRADVPALLLVDDADDVHLLYDRWLADLGLPLLAARDADAALRLAEEAELAAAVVDLELPDLDGIELSRRLHRRSPDLPILLVTGHDPDGLRARAEAAGVSVVLGKPLNRERLLGEVRVHLGAEGEPVELARVDADLLDLVEEYVATRREELSDLRAALERGDLASVARTGHRLRGSGGTYGLPKISTLGARLEQAGRAGDAPAAAAALEELADWLGRVRLEPA